MKKIVTGCADCPNVQQTSFDMLSPRCGLTKKAIEYTVTWVKTSDGTKMGLMGVQKTKPKHCPLK